MAKTNNKTCKVCGKDYYYCHSCGHTDPAWKQLVCSEECNTVWNALSRNGVGLATTQETLDALAGIKMPANLEPNVQAHIDRLKAEVKPVIKKIETPVAVSEPEEQPSEEVVFQPKKKKKFESIDE